MARSPHRGTFELTLGMGVSCAPRHGSYPDPGFTHHPVLLHDNP